MMIGVKGGAALLLGASLALAACGVDGPPQRPEPARAVASPSPGVSVSGDAYVGLRAEGL